MGKNKLIHEIRQKMPGLARRADGGNVRAGVRLFCLECTGGNRGLVDSCGVVDCPLWPWRFGTGERERPNGTYDPLPEKREAAPGAFGRGEKQEQEYEVDECLDDEEG